MDNIVLYIISLAFVVALSYVGSVIIHETGHAFFDIVFGFKVLKFRCFFIARNFETNSWEFGSNKKYSGCVTKEIPENIRERWFQHMLGTAGGVIFNAIESLIFIFLFRFYLERVDNILDLGYLIIWLAMSLSCTICNFIPTSSNEKQDKTTFYRKNKHLIYEIVEEDENDVTYIQGSDGYSLLRDLKRCFSSKKK